MAEDIAEAVASFESLVLRALKAKYSSLPDGFFELHPLVAGWRADKFYTAYVAASRRAPDEFPPGRATKLAYQVIDIKLQFYFVHEMLGLHNRVVYDAGYDDAQPLAQPHLLLTRLALDQNVITQSRALWERIMNFVFFLETGTELEAKKSAGRSKKKAFFLFIEQAKKWQFLRPIKDLLDKHENKFRTPEMHGDSVLRKVALGRSQVDLNEILNLTNSAQNVIWSNVLDIVEGREPRSRYVE